MRVCNWCGCEVVEVSCGTDMNEGWSVCRGCGAIEGGDHEEEG